MKPGLKLLLCAFLLILTPATYAEDHPSYLKKGTWRHYDTLDGLAYNIVSDIHQAPDGHLWFATQGSGMARTRFPHRSPPHPIDS